ncbi:hypothetical protein AB0K60_34770 [Thermopolyspora sp. NPDC052614]|uniref:hypothetical protein n=1 Tax=Thermopolyspora sp. NPDC052614 TaxID=3155682 RepID=UPI0034425321
MKKFVAVVAATLIAPALVAAAATPSAAQAAPHDPAAAIKQQFAKKSGVRVDDTLRLAIGRDVLLRGRVSGLVRFGPAGVNAFSLKSSLRGSELKFDAHSIATGKHYYVRSNEPRTRPRPGPWASRTWSTPLT